ncbi:MAG: HepT-like ribonuclease domain-containing protein [Campylobacterota bacterium]|nr:HepT-like ribonuclease domain-containing protein [Campylobacterota bacterium]
MSNISKIRYNLLAFMEAIDKIETYSLEFDNGENFYYDTKSFDASMMQFVVIGELISRLNDEYKATHDNIPWQQIKDFRNIITHDYFGIDADEIWSIIQFHLLPLKDNIQKLIDEL